MSSPATRPIEITRLLEFRAAWTLVLGSEIRSVVCDTGSKRHEDNSGISRFFRRHSESS